MVLVFQPVALLHQLPQQELALGELGRVGPDFLDLRLLGDGDGADDQRLQPSAVLEDGFDQQVVGGVGGLDELPFQARDAAVEQELGQHETEHQRGVEQDHGVFPRCGDTDLTAPTDVARP